ncbi:MAG: EFR1 family ferrodoxin [Tannerellaceae bacterium]|nr:EFR1 family ferrodoxin [Tannerellaceae bacterium]
MIFYFTGTGNSYWLAQALGKALHEPWVSITDLWRSSTDSFNFPLAAEEYILFVYPVHSWGPPVIVRQFIERLSFAGYQGQKIYSVCTCGDDCGYTTEILEHSLKKKGYSLAGSFSVTMPNNYILFPGFDVDPEEVASQKRTVAAGRVAEIVTAIREGKKNTELYTRGTVPFLKSRVIRPFFVTFALGKNDFYATDACISCGLCEKVCPTKTIRIRKDRPVWNHTCIQCSACIHRCPVRAIEYGKISLKKGRYVHPDYK